MLPVRYGYPPDRRYPDLDVRPVRLHLEAPEAAWADALPWRRLSVAALALGTAEEEAERRLMASAYWQLRRCARHQWEMDSPMRRALIARTEPFGHLEGPNLLISTGPRCRASCPPDCEDHVGLLLPILMLRAG